MPQELNYFNTNTPLDLTSLLINLAIGLLLSLLLRWHFRRFGSTLSNREEFTQVFPFILLTTVLIITVVKSSLALSLGLVGALSIVRFRTPIKEPEELAYLFIAIAMGLGLGANQTLPTAIGGITILLFMALFKFSHKKNQTKNFYLSIDITGEQPSDFISNLSLEIEKHCIVVDLRRFDSREQSFEATYFIDVKSTTDLSDLTSNLQLAYPRAGITFIDQNNLPSI